MLRTYKAALLALASAVVLCVGAGAVTRVPSSDGQFWDIQDTSAWAQDSGGIATGGRAYPFNGFGYLKLQVSAPGRPPAHRNQYLRGFGLSFDDVDRFDSITPLLQDGIVISRAIMAPRDASYLRYFDTFTNTTAGNRIVQIAWGGAAGAYEDGGKVAVAITSSGDRRIDAADSFVTVMQNARGVADPMRGPSGHGPSAHVLGSKTAGLRTGVGDMYADPFVDPYPGFDPSHIGYLYTLRLAPGETAALVTFVVKGLSEVYDPRGGFPIPIKDGLVTGEAVYAGPDQKVPAAGSEIARVTRTARELVAHPDLRGLTPRELSQITNWTLPAAQALPRFTVFEKTVPELQDAMVRGDVTSQDIVREYLARLAMYDRNGPTFRALLSLNPKAIADARASDAERAAGRVRSRFHGVPVVFKDNIDVLGLPTTGGSLALVDHHPRLDAHIAAGMRAGGAIVLGKANLDEFPFGDFGISSVGGTIGNAYDPSLSTGRIERRERDGCRDESRGTRIRHRHMQLALESGGIRFAGHDPGDARAEQPCGRDAAQHVQRRRRADGEDRARRGTRARSRDGDGFRRSRHDGCERAQTHVVRCGPRHRDAERHTHRVVAPAFRWHHGRARDRGCHGPRGEGVRGGGRDGG